MTASSSSSAGCVVRAISGCVPGALTVASSPAPRPLRKNSPSGRWGRSSVAGGSSSLGSPFVSESSGSGASAARRLAASWSGLKGAVESSLSEASAGGSVFLVSTGAAGGLVCSFGGAYASRSAPGSGFLSMFDFARSSPEVASGSPCFMRSTRRQASAASRGSASCSSHIRATLRARSALAVMSLPRRIWSS